MNIPMTSHRIGQFMRCSMCMTDMLASSMGVSADGDTLFSECSPQLHFNTDKQYGYIISIRCIYIYINKSINQQILEKEIRIEREGDRDCLV